MVTPWNSSCKWISLSPRAVEFFILFMELFILFCCYYFYLLFWTHEIEQHDISWPACPKINNGSVQIELDIIIVIIFLLALLNSWSPARWHFMASMKWSRVNGLKIGGVTAVCPKINNESVQIGLDSDVCGFVCIQC